MEWLSKDNSYFKAEESPMLLCRYWQHFFLIFIFLVFMRENIFYNQKSYNWVVCPGYTYWCNLDVAAWKSILWSHNCGRLLLHYYVYARCMWQFYTTSTSLKYWYLKSSKQTFLNFLQIHQQAYLITRKLVQEFVYSGVSSPGWWLRPIRARLMEAGPIGACW